MRKCLRCGSEMVEGCDIKVDGAAYGIKIANGTGVFANRIDKPKVAICPACGEVSLYIENISSLQK